MAAFSPALGALDLETSLPVALAPERGAGFVVAALVQLVAKVTKLGWFDDGAFREIVDDVAKFAHASVAHCVVALRVLRDGPLAALPSAAEPAVSAALFAADPLNMWLSQKARDDEDAPLPSYEEPARIPVGARGFRE